MPPSPVALHRTMPGAQLPVHPFSEQTVVQGTDGPHSPLSLQVELMLSSHFLSPGLQMPTQAPLMHRNGQVASTSQVPLPLQTRTASPLQSFAPTLHRSLPASGWRTE
jgi:hypothetical protein